MTIFTYEKFLHGVISAVFFANLFFLIHYMYDTYFSNLKRIWRCSQTFNLRSLERPGHRCRTWVKERSVLADSRDWVFRHSWNLFYSPRGIYPWVVDKRQSVSRLFMIQLGRVSNGVIVNPVECLSWLSSGTNWREPILFRHSCGSLSSSWDLCWIAASRRSLKSVMRPANSDGRCISSEILQRDCVSVPAGGSINEPGSCWPFSVPSKFPMTTVKRCNYESLIAVTMPGRPTLRMNARASSLSNSVFLNCAFSFTSKNSLLFIDEKTVARGNQCMYRIL